MTRPDFLYVVRHGQTDWNKIGRYQGQIDIPLNNEGRRQAARNGMTLAAHLADTGLLARQISFVTSPLSRARETMNFVRQSCSLPHDGYHQDERFIEASYGVWEGITLAEAKAADPTTLARRRADPVNFAPEHGESFHNLGTRVLNGLAHLVSPTILVAHGGVIKVIWGAYLGLEPHDALSLDIRQDRVFRFQDGQVEFI